MIYNEDRNADQICSPISALLIMTIMIYVVHGNCYDRTYVVHSVRITKLIPWVINKAGLHWDALRGQMSEHDLDLEGGVQRQRERER